MKRERRPRRDHDRSYRLLFSHPEMVADLLQGFVAEPWVEQLQLDTLELRPGSYLSEGLAARSQDLVWRVRFHDRWLYLYLLFEFQSRVDRAMALRMLVYVGLLYQDLLRQGEAAPGGKLPPVLPLVLYNGQRPWRAAREVGELIAVPALGLESYAPKLRYLLLDVGGVPEGKLARPGDRVAALFRVERARGAEELARDLEGLLAAVEGSREELQRAVARWLSEALRSQLGEIEDLTAAEVEPMLSERIRKWERQWWREGRREGRKEGRREGRKEGEKEGEAALLLRQLERKFGTVDPAMRRRIEAASAEELLLWGERVLTASRPEEILAAE